LNDLMILNISGIECFEKDGTAYLKLETVARGLGFTKTEIKNGVEYNTVRWERVFGFLDENYPIFRFALAQFSKKRLAFKRSFSICVSSGSFPFRNE
jgi:hypothetical protein